MNKQYIEHSIRRRVAFVLNRHSISNTRKSLSDSKLNHWAFGCDIENDLQNWVGTPGALR